MKKLRLIVTEDYFELKWWSPRTWSPDRRRYWEIIVMGYGAEMTTYHYGITQAVRKVDIELMAIEYAALQDDGRIEDYRVGEIAWSK